MDFFIVVADSSAAFFITNQSRCEMQLKLISNPDARAAVAYQVARVVYAETGGASLPLVTAMVSMISNIATRFGRELIDIVSDAELFGALNPTSPRNELLNVDADDRRFRMCLRVVWRMMAGGWRDTVYGAVRFHHADVMPDWATSRGYIADIDGILFYL